MREFIKQYGSRTVGAHISALPRKHPGNWGAGLLVPAYLIGIRPDDCRVFSPGYPVYLRSRVPYNRSLFNQLTIVIQVQNFIFEKGTKPIKSGAGDLRVVYDNFPLPPGVQKVTKGSYFTLLH